MRGTLALFAALALAAGVAACGSDDNKSDSSGTPAAASGGGGSEKSGKIAGAIGEGASDVNAFLINGLVCTLGGLVFLRALPRLRIHVHPIYRRLGILRDD